MPPAINQTDWFALFWFEFLFNIYSFKTLINPAAIDEAVNQRTRNRAMPNPWQQAQQRRERNRERGRPLGNVRGVQKRMDIYIWFLLYFVFFFASSISLHKRMWKQSKRYVFFICLFVCLLWYYLLIATSQIPRGGGWG